MPDLYYSIANEVFAQFPGYVRGVVLAFDVTNGSSSDELVSLLRSAEESVRSQLKADTIADYPKIKSWRDAYRAFGAKPSEFRSSIEALARRALHQQELPSINALVDIGNVLSLRHIVPVGGHAIDVLTQNIALRPATGEEEFVPFGSDQLEHPLPGEIIFAEGTTVLTRRWTWRQANHTLTLPETRAIEFNIDGLSPVTPSEVEEIGQALTGMIKHYCGGRIRFEMLTQGNPRIKLTE